MANKKISSLTGATTPLAGTELVPVVQSGATVNVTVANLTVGRAVTVDSLLATSASDNSITVQSTGTSSGASVIIRSGNGTSASLYSYARFINDNTAGQDWRLGIYGDSDIQLVNSTGSKNLMRWGTGGDVTFNSGNLLQGTAAKGINFTANTPAAGMTSQLLNWYEEGTWTPNQGAGLTVVGAFSSNGTYIRVGRSITVKGQVLGATTVAVAAAGVISTNLPFAAASGHAGSMFNAAATASGVVAVTTSTVTAATAITATASITFTATYQI